MKLLYVCPSKSKTKKFVATFELDSGKFKRVSFGSKGYSDFTGEAGTQEPTTEDQKKSYIARHSKDRLTDPLSPGALSMYILWSSRDINKAIRDYRKRFKLG